MIEMKATEADWQHVVKKPKPALVSDLTSKFWAYHRTEFTDKLGKVRTNLICQVCEDTACHSRAQLQVGNPNLQHVFPTHRH